jgi:hypothetical protein
MIPTAPQPQLTRDESVDRSKEKHAQAAADDTQHDEPLIEALSMLIISRVDEMFRAEIHHSIQSQAV